MTIKKFYEVICKGCGERYIVYERVEQEGRFSDHHCELSSDRRKLYKLPKRVLWFTRVRKGDRRIT